MLKTPILFLIFNRPDLTEKVFEEIQKIKPEKLFIAADGPRPDIEGEDEKCRQAREIIEKIDWNCEIKTLFREKNVGLRIAVTGALDWFFEHVEQGIILEDDCLPDPSFFTFCENLLNYYKDNERIMHIAGSNFQDGNRWGNGSYYFSQISAQCWGWASWRRAWALNRPKMEGYKEFKAHNILFDKFKNQKFVDFWQNYYQNAYDNKISSWNAIWSYSIVSANGLCVIPNKNLVSNIGFGENASNCKSKEYSVANLPLKSITKLILPNDTEFCNEADFYIINEHFVPEKSELINIKETKKFKLFTKKVKEQQSKVEYCCKKDDKTVIHEQTKIFNIANDPQKISFGKNTHVRGEFYVFPSGGIIKIGNYCYVGENTRLWSACSIEIGDRVLIGHDVNIFDHNTHPIDPLERHEHFKQIITTGFPQKIDNLCESPIKIEDDVWIGAKSIILQGVTIGEGAIIGAGSVVTKDIEPYTIVAGSSAKFIKNVPINGEALNETLKQVY